jgi:hypothetical protein
VSRGDIEQARALLDAGPDVLAQLWLKVDALAKHRKVDPELRGAILNMAAKIDPSLVAQTERELDEAVPAAVLEAHQAELVEDRPALGAFPRRDTLNTPTADEWLREDPRRLRGVALEAGRFCCDNRSVAQGVLQLAENLGIDLQLAGDIVAQALIDSRHHSAVAK